MTVVAEHCTSEKGYFTIQALFAILPVFCGCSHLLTRMKRSDCSREPTMELAPGPVASAKRAALKIRQLRSLGYRVKPPTVRVDHPYLNPVCDIPFQEQ